ncbi:MULTISPECIES: (2Fe-2S) ferredoxin domain-containing protein [unclassified Ruminococcus]|uniref:(2Fe-2S) ferredoxin domain-containing protein n=1 Tax=unclassified Ruminococcus TaxID=2608920 RepID=UPI00210E9C7D|nr:MULTISPECIES: NAD(P)H-dependent oxidoreductase subunit E [unclassified Ruminococcus]MCQ4022298.1 (2Fe-2S) ferredoxin domain-containing protein [Ruminococcus sp. zg-924]MCQ4114626.1 (2Fe-2S) ferredoxin domain-containing protein [Ruminococcus sp. zg-921]
MKVYVCVGSSCHLRGSYDIINLMKESIAKRQLEDKVELSAAFCLGKCTDGVSVKFDDEVVCGVSKDNFDEIFSDYVLSKI